MTNCKAQFYDCLIAPGMTFTNSTAIAYSADLGAGLLPGIDIVSAKTMRNGNLFASYRPLQPVNDTFVEGGTYVASFDGTTASLTSIPDFAGGNTFETCLSKTASGAGRVECYQFSVIGGNYYYIKCEVKLNSSAVPQCYVKGTGAVIATDFGSLLVKDKWVTLHLLGQATSTGSVDFWFNANGGSIDVSFGACTVVQVTDFNKIQGFFNSGRHIRQKKINSFTATAVPAAINNAYVGARIYNSTPSVGQPKSWVCTVAGTPGTWVSEGNL